MKLILISLLMGTVLLSACSQETSPAQFEIYPDTDSIEELIQAGSEIIITFDTPMQDTHTMRQVNLPDNPSYSVTTTWTDQYTLVLTFHRLTSRHSIDITITNLVDAEDRRLGRAILLKYD